MRRTALFLTFAAIATVACARDNRPAPTSSAPATTASTATQAPAATAPTAPTAAQSNVTFASLGGNGSGYLALPSSSGRKPALIVIQEWWGLNDWVRQQADRFAGDGYVALAVDLYRGRVAHDQETAHELSRALPQDRAMADLKAAYASLAARPDVDPQRIGVIGWCMGGGYALQLALAEPHLAAGVVNYGMLVTDPATIASLRVPLLGNFGADDKGITPDDVHAFGDALKKAGKDADLKIYEHAGHAFMNPNNTGGYNAPAAADANARIDHFFAQKLRANIPNS